MRTQGIGVPFLVSVCGISLLMLIWVYPHRVATLGPITKVVLTVVALALVLWFPLYVFLTNPYAKPRKSKTYGMLKDSGISSDEYLRQKREDTAREEAKGNERLKHYGKKSDFERWLDNPDDLANAPFKQELLQLVTNDPEGREMLIDAEIAGPETWKGEHDAGSK